MVKGFTVPDNLLKKILQVETRTILLLGASDSGKTTLVKQLAEFCSIRNKVAIVDADPGQSHIGPPTTVGWAMVEGGFGSWDTLRVENFYFIGNKSPVRNLLPTVTGARLIHDKAARFADKIIVDTPGLVRGGLGKALNLNLIDILKPNIVLALQSSNELDHILSFFRSIQLPEVYKIPVPSGIRKKSFAQRGIFREEKFKNYFKQGEDIQFAQQEIGLQGNFSPDYLNLRLVSLRDKENEDIALGIIKDFNKSSRLLTIYSPLKEPEKVGAVVLGQLRLTLKGIELRL